MLKKLERKGKRHKPSIVENWIRTDFAQFGNVKPPEDTKDFIKSLWKPSFNIGSELALLWLLYNQLFFHFNLGSYLDDRVKLIQYESAVVNPHQEFAALCLFLGIPVDHRIGEGVFISSIRRNPSPSIDPEICKNCEELWQRLCSQAGKSNEINPYL